ncbi:MULTISPECIES: hypothetical protein [Methylobacter]|uniref:hypothetical protein n=1 Tax=Methylobacter TaxID=429 RepID=UPI001FABBE7A|nr:MULTISPECIES: hypothetical protein [Methylobacter]UOA10242.1 hypothetical protein KKZ03_08425 [Methylobacter sp. S3L5C]
MEPRSSSQELHHEIFGSILDRAEMTPYLLLSADNYQTALRQATKMMNNRGFDIIGNGELQESEQKRAKVYINRTYNYFFNWMFAFVKPQLEGLFALDSINAELYRGCLQAIEQVEAVLNNKGFQDIVHDDPRHLFLLASSRKYPAVFHGYQGENRDVSLEWQQTACSLLKMGYLIKSIEEESQDINDYAQLGFFLETEHQSLDDLFNYDWENPKHIPASESAQNAFVKISSFFHKLKESITVDDEQNSFVFDSGDGVRVNITEIKARLKSPESMVTKLGKDLEGEAYDIRDILAITFILKDKDDTLKLFHALQKKGVILQENTNSQSITQTLFDDPKSMIEAVRRLMISLSKSAGYEESSTEQDLLANAKTFYEALSMNAKKNQHSSLGHRKFQCKISFSLPIHREAETHKIMIPGTPIYARRNQINKQTQEHTLGVELRISDEESWRTSEQKGDSHHDAYKFRQLIWVMNRVLKNVFHLPKESISQLKKDQSILFS